MKLIVRSTLWVLAAVLLAGCAAGAGSGDGGDRNVIPEETLAEYSGQNVYEVIQRIRPAWLRARGMGMDSSTEGVMVYLDGAPLSGVDELRTWDVNQVQEIRHLDARDATTRFGTGHSNGAILVTTKR